MKNTYCFFFIWLVWVGFFSCVSCSTIYIISPARFLKSGVNDFEHFIPDVLLVSIQHGKPKQFKQCFSKMLLMLAIYYYAEEG